MVGLVLARFAAGVHVRLGDDLAHDDEPEGQRDDVAAVSRMSAVSVISSVNVAGSRAVSFSAWRTSSMNSSSSSWWAETFTDMPIRWPRSCQ